MICCSNNDVIKGKDYEQVQGQLKKISIQIEPTWRGLYFCCECNTYWEENFTDDRFGGSPYLRRVTAQYVETEWGKGYLIDNVKI